MTSPTKVLHQSIRVMVVNHNSNEHAFTPIPTTIDGQYKFEELNFSQALNQFSNGDWFSDNDYFPSMLECIQFLDGLKNFVFDIEQNKTSGWWYVGVYDDELAKLLNEVKKSNSK